MRGIVVHSLRGDRRSEQLKALLERAGVAFDLVDVAGVSGVPAPEVFVDGQEVGGYEVLLRLESEDRLAAVLGPEDPDEDPLAAAFF